MKRLFVFLIATISLIASCGVISQSPVRSGKSIPTTFFNCTLGCNLSYVNSAMERLDYYSSWGLSARQVLPLGKRKIKTWRSYSHVPYGGYTWQEASFLFDYRDRFFCIAFTQDFSTAYAESRYNDLKATLDEKYGVGTTTEYGVLYGNPQGKCIVLAIVPHSDKEGAMCGLYYMDDKIYRTSTAEATDEL